jgi:RNA polymerase primary sigma factor
MVQRRIQSFIVPSKVLDAASLLADERPSPRPALLEGRPEPRAQRAPHRPPKAVLPKPGGRASGKRGRRDSGRDEMLSEYLSSLGRIPLLTPDDEQRLAARFRDAEVRCWRVLLSLGFVRELLSDHPLLHDATGAVREALARLGEAHGRSERRAADDDLELIADALRELDDDRHVIEEMAGALADAASGRSGRERRLFLEVLDEARAARRHALDVRNRFVRANLRLVVSVARRFHHYRLPLIDLIQEGNLGLIKSVHRFDHRKGFRFSTYAHWWIRQAIERAIMNKGAQVRLPVHVFDARREVAKATRDLQAQLGREPTIEELARELQTPLEKLQEVLRAVPREPHSLDEPVGDDEERTLGEVICDQDALTPDEHVIRVDEERWVRRVLTRLSPMEVDILRRRFGLDTDEDETLEEIGRSYNLSRERVRQIQVQGLKKIQRIVEVRIHAG